MIILLWKTFSEYLNKNFEAFVNDERMIFNRDKSKEILAYLVNLKGAAANTNELCAVIFQNDSNSNKHYLRNLLSDLKNTLDKYEVKDVFVYKRNNYSINPNKIECDYYKYLNYDVAAINSYAGEYMKQYSWAEMTNGYLTSHST